MTRTATRALLAVLVAAWWLVVPVIQCAWAEDRVKLPGQGRITDRVDALGDREGEVVPAVDRLHDHRRIELPVAYACGFSGKANGCDDTVLASKPTPSPAVTPVAADPGEGREGVSTTDLILPVAVLGGVAALSVYIYGRRRRRVKEVTTPGRRQTAPEARHEEPSPDPPGPLPGLDELDIQARRTLVDTDDALRTSEEELGFATAQFGQAATTPFTEAVVHAQDELSTAFRLRQALDDAYFEDEASRRQMLDEIISRCAEANRLLDAEAEGFDRLRALEGSAPQALATAESACQELDGRARTAEVTLGVMRERYGESGCAPVASDVQQARERLLFASTSLDRARQSAGTGDVATAAVHIRAAEGGVDQAGRLIDAVDGRAQDLAEAAGKLPGAISGTVAVLTDVRELLKDTAEGTAKADLRGRIGEAETVVAQVQRATEAGPYDPIDALRRLVEVAAVLEAALPGTGEREQEARRSALLDRATLAARSTLAGATDFVTTHRGAVVTRARTRLAEARRLLERSRELAELDETQGALADAQRADSLAREGLSLAEEDVLSYGNPFGSGGAQGGGGGFGGAVLGGIILGGPVGGERGHGGGGDHDGGPGDGGSGVGPASFGGGGTRGRLGGGGF
ncbi:TPM domain-containing protein [Streptomyces sp. NPDC057445]|uniref:TPM domain-containing protein n=1 Tax=Streptomyces sp. NPDC057445 TaxID=3346136 RepID=UPI0036C1C6F6